MRIGCGLSNQCRNYKIDCGWCSCNWELDRGVEEEEFLEDYSDDCNEEEGEYD